MGEFLSMDNILTGDEAAALFSDEMEEVKQEENTPAELEENITTEVSSDDLFEEEPESVGSEEEVNNQEEDTASDEDGSSPDNNFYSSIASALKEEGVFPDLDDETISRIQEPEDFRALVQMQIQQELTEVQQRIYDAMNAGIEPSEIKKYETSLSYLNQITDQFLEDESAAAEQVRRLLIFSDFTSRGYSKERANSLTQKLIEKGEDIDEAKQALISQREYTQQKYKLLLANAEYNRRREALAQQKLMDDLKKSILEADKAFDSIPLDNATKQKAYSFLSKPVYKNPDTGQYLTEWQRYQMYEHNDYAKNVSILYALTDGFKNIDRLVQPAAKKEVKSKLKELEHTLKNTNRSSGNLKYVGTAPSSKGTIFDNDFLIDLS